MRTLKTTGIAATLVCLILFDSHFHAFPDGTFIVIGMLAGFVLERIWRKPIL